MRTCPTCRREFAATDTAERCPEDGSLLVEKVSAEEQAIGKTLDGKYRVDGFLKRGGMGSVYRGTHVLLNKPVAIKLIRPELVTSDDMVKRFFREARAAAKLAHPNIVTVHDLGQTEDGTLYIIMELVDGRSLKEIIQAGGPWAPARALRFLRGVASALSLAHRSGIVHRDLKPQNIMVFQDSEGNETPKLLDFGIAKTLEPDSPALTSTGMVLGTPHYMSAEQAKGLPADQRSDIYALGVILYEMLVGKVPFDDKSIPSILVKHLTEAPRPPSTLKGDIPREVEALVLKCLEKDPERRLQSADELARSLAGLVDTQASTRVLDPTLAMEAPPSERATVASQPQITMGAGTAVATFRPPVPPLPATPPSAPSGSMESGTVRAREIRPASPLPQPVKPAQRSSAGLLVFLALGFLMFLFVIGAGAFLYLRLRSQPSPEASAAGTDLDVEAERTTPESTDTPPPTPPNTEVTAEAAPTAPPPVTSSAPPVATVSERPPERRPQPAATTAPAMETSPPAERRSEPQPEPEPPIPQSPSVGVECEGVKDACAVIRNALRDALTQRGMTPARAMRADVLVTIQAEEIEARTEEQFGNTFVIRTYSVTLDAEAPRFGDSVSLPPRTFSFDARLGREKLRAEAHVIAASAAERIEKYWETKRPR
jgi:serine/threonine-protein kinase